MEDRRGLPDRHRRATQLTAGGVSWDVVISFTDREDFKLESAEPTESILDLLEHYPATQQILDLLQVAVVEAMPELLRADSRATIKEIK